MRRWAILIGICSICIGAGVVLGHRDFFSRIAPKERSVSVRPQAAAAPRKRDTEQKVRDEHSLQVIRQSEDEMLTGDPNGYGVWNAPTSSEHEMMCGVTPTGRYIVETTNNHGQIRYDEPAKTDSNFINRWVKLGCQETSPVNTQLEERTGAIGEMAWRSHPAIPSCTMLDIHFRAANDYESVAALERRTHHCRDPEAWAREPKKTD